MPAPAEGAQTSVRPSGSGTVGARFSRESPHVASFRWCGWWINKPAACNRAVARGRHNIHAHTALKLPGSKDLPFAWQSMSTLRVKGYAQICTVVDIDLAKLLSDYL